MIGPNKGLKGSLLASTMCFSFVYLWHGLMPHVMLWSFLNYVGIVCETVSKAIWQTATYQRIEVWKIKNMILHELDSCKMLIFPTFFRNPSWDQEANVDFTHWFLRHCSWCQSLVTFTFSWAKISAIYSSSKDSLLGQLERQPFCSLCTAALKPLLKWKIGKFDVKWRKYRQSTKPKAI